MTTHAMTHIIVSPRNDTSISYPRIQRTGERTLNDTVPGGSLSTVLHYKKPVKRPEPVISPQTTVDELKNLGNSAQDQTATEFIYSFGRRLSKSLPPWSVFHSKLTQTPALEVSNVVYNPILMAPPSDQNTIYTILKRAKEEVNGLGFDSTPVYFDMSLLTKALEICWSRPNELAGVVPCDGGMHFVMAVIAGIGHLFSDAGLKNLLCESGAFAAGTVRHMLSGKEYERAIKGLLMVDEALCDRLLCNFEQWCEEKNKVIPVMGELVKVSEAISSKSSNVEAICNDIKSGSLKDTMKLLEEFINEGKSMYPTFDLWVSFLFKIMCPFKVLLAAIHTGDWKAYQAARSQLLPLLFASNRSVYSKYMSVVILLLERLPDDLHQSFLNGLFVAVLSEGVFNAVAMDV